MDQRPIYSPSLAASSHSSRGCHLIARARSSVTYNTGTVEASWHSAVGPESRLPNVYWGAMSTTSLRRMSCYTALPPEEEVIVDGEASYRYVRQGTALWSALHAGRITTSRLKDALGLRDPTASRRVGGPQYPQLGVMEAYEHLMQPLFAPPPPSYSSPAAAGRCSGTEALELNEAARLQFNDAMETAAAAANPVDSPSGSRARAQMPGPGPRSRSVGQRRRRQLQGGGSGGGGKDPADEEAWSPSERRRVSELAALAVGPAGAARMRLLWGSLQEASAVITLAVLFPGSQLEEVGLLCLPDPRPWGFEPGELPPLGASPDALIVHHVPVTRADIQAARAELWSAAGGGGDAARSELRDAAQRVARAVLRSALVRHTQQPHSNTKMPAPPGTPLTTAASPTLTPAIGTSSSGSNSASCFRSRSPPLFASGSEEATEWLVGELLRPEAGSEPGSAGSAAQVSPTSSSPSFLPPSRSSLPQYAGGGPAAGCGGASHPADEVLAVVRLREAVEVKNHCPFVYKGQRKARKQGLVIDYVVRDRGPLESPWPLWVPQLQAHMACSGADSVLLLSRSPSRGVRVFRIFRDDAYISAAFDVLRELQCGHVAQQRPPGCDPWVGRPGYDDLLQRTAAIARAAETVVGTSTTPQIPGTDPCAFWDLRR